MTIVNFPSDKIICNRCGHVVTYHVLAHTKKPPKNREKEYIYIFVTYICQVVNGDIFQ